MIVSAGVCRSTVRIIDGAASTLTHDQIDLEIPGQNLKQLDVAWAPFSFDPDGTQGGDRSGGRSASALSNTTWHSFAIGSPGLPSDILFHDSVTQSSVIAALPAGYTAYRRVGSIIRSGGAILGVTQLGDRFRHKIPIADISATNPGTSAVSRTLTVPLGIVTLAEVSVKTAASATGFYLLLSSLDETDTVPSIAAFTFDNANFSNSNQSGTVYIKTNTSAQVRSRVESSDANVTLVMVTRGWIDDRGKNA